MPGISISPMAWAGSSHSRGTSMRVVMDISSSSLRLSGRRSSPGCGGPGQCGMQGETVREQGRQLRDLANRQPARRPIVAPGIDQNEMHSGGAGADLVHAPDIADVERALRRNAELFER